jgi:hypothetical protein
MASKTTVAERIAERMARENRKTEIVHTTALEIRELLDSALAAYKEQDPEADLDEVESQILDMILDAEAGS